MKWLWIVLGVIGLGCVACGGFGYWAYNKGTGMMADSTKYGDESMEAIARNWDAAALTSRAAPELIAQNPAGTLEKVVATLKQSLGPMKSFKGKTTSFNAKTTTETGSYIEAGYEADGEFEKGPGRITMTLLQRGDKWSILKIYGGPR